MEVTDEDINLRIAEFMCRSKTYIDSIEKRHWYTESLDSLTPAVDQVLFKLKISVWVEPRLGISGVVFNSWTKRAGGHPRVNAMTDESPSLALSLAIYQVLGERK